MQIRRPCKHAQLMLRGEHCRGTSRARIAHDYSPQDGHGIDGEYQALEKFRVFRRRIHAPTHLA